MQETCDGKCRGTGWSWRRRRRSVEKRSHWMKPYGGPRVRIRLPPAESHVRTCLSREFVFLRREAAVFRGCAGRGERRGRQRRAGRGNIGPTGGNISVGPFFSTAVPSMWFATVPALARQRGRVASGRRDIGGSF